MNIEDDSQEQPPSKTRLKKEMHALQEIGTELTKFSEAQLSKLSLPDKLHNAIREFKRLPNSHGARRRQIQFIGRLMRDLELETIKGEIDELLNPSRIHAGAGQALDRQCDEILHIGDEAINTLLLQHEHLERQLLRKYHLDHRKARKTNDESACQAARNKLKTYLKAQLS